MKNKTLKEIYLKESYFGNRTAEQIAALYQKMRSRLKRLDDLLQAEQNWVQTEGSPPYFREPGRIEREIEGLDYLPQEFREVNKAIKEAMKTDKEREEEKELSKKNMSFISRLTSRK